MIWRYTGTPCDGTRCPGWERLDNNPRTREIVAAGGATYTSGTTMAAFGAMSVRRAAATAVPDGSNWTTIQGRSISPWEDSTELVIAVACVVTWRPWTTFR